MCCIPHGFPSFREGGVPKGRGGSCLLYTSDAADEL